VLNPTRKNKNIGTAKQGHGKNNKLRIPKGFPGKEFYEHLPNAEIVKRKVHDRELVFYIEPTLDGFQHCCSVDDICYLLEQVPEDDVDGIDLFLFRQPKRKERILSSVWGRLIYWATLGKKMDAQGTAICLEAQEPPKKLLWTRKQSPYYVRELERLKGDGHKVRETKRHFVIEGEIEAIRSTQLRSTLHEIGHYVDFMRSFESKVAEKHFETKPWQEKEDFAHRYADTMLKKLGLR